MCLKIQNRKLAKVSSKQLTVNPSIHDVINEWSCISLLIVYEEGHVIHGSPVGHLDLATLVVDCLDALS